MPYLDDFQPSVRLEKPIATYSLPEAGYCGMLRKIKVSKSATEKEILDECKKQLGHDSCKLIHGSTVEVVFQTSPPTDTIAVVVDISSAGGAIKIGEASDNNLGVTAVGMVELRMQTVWLSCHGRADDDIIQSVLSRCDIS